MMCMASIKITLFHEVITQALDYIQIQTQRPVGFQVFLFFIASKLMSGCFVQACKAHKFINTNLWCRCMYHVKCKGFVCESMHAPSAAWVWETTVNTVTAKWLQEARAWQNFLNDEMRVNDCRCHNSAVSFLSRGTRQPCLCFINYLVPSSKLSLKVMGICLC